MATKIRFYLYFVNCLMNQPISLIVCVHNEENNLPVLLESIKPGKDDEILIILDRCTDQSEQIADRFSFILPIRKIRIAETEWPESPKKWAVFLGISHAANQNLVFTDADCILPVSFFSEYRSQFNRSDVIAGYSLPVFEPNSGFLQELQWMDALFTAIKYTYFYQFSCPYMSVGRNWGFKKNLFKKEFLESHAMIKSGDDDLLFQKLLSNNPKVALLKLNAATTGTKRSWKDLINQKARHYKAGSKYPVKILILLVFYDLWFPASILFLMGSIYLNSFQSVVIGSSFIFASVIFITAQSRRLLSELGLFVSSITRISLFALPYHFLLPFLSVFLQVLRPKWKS